MWKTIDINESFILKQKTPKVVIIWLIFIIIGFTLFILIGGIYEYYKYDSYIGYIKKVEEYKLYIYAKEVSSLNDKILIIDNKEYAYEINSISEDYYLVDDSNYYLVELNVSLENKYLINNNIIDLKIKKDKTTLLKEIGGKFWKN